MLLVPPIYLTAHAQIIFFPWQSLNYGQLTGIEAMLDKVEKQGHLFLENWNRITNVWGAISSSLTHTHTLSTQAMLLALPRENKQEWWHKEKGHGLNGSLNGSIT